MKGGTMSDFLVSLIRTWVPIAVGFALTWIAAKLDIIVSEDTSAQVTALAVSAVIALYYLVARWLEQRVPWAGRLLGVSKEPSYYDE